MKVKTVAELMAWLIVPGLIYFAWATKGFAGSNRGDMPRLNPSILATKVRQSLGKYKGLYTDADFMPFVHKGAYNVVLFVNPTCEVCEVAISHIENYFPEWKNPPCVTLVVLQDSALARQKRWTTDKRIKIHYATETETVSIQQRFGQIDSFPMCVMTDTNRNIIYVTTGIRSTSPTSDNVVTVVDKLVNSKSLVSWNEFAPIVADGSSPGIKKLIDLSRQQLVVGLYADGMDEAVLAKWGVLQTLSKSGNVTPVCVVSSEGFPKEALSASPVVPQILVDDNGRFRSTLGVNTAPILFLMRDGVAFARESDANTQTEAILDVAQQAVISARLEPEAD